MFDYARCVSLLYFLESMYDKSSRVHKFGILETREQLWQSHDLSVKRGVEREQRLMKGTPGTME